MNAFAPALAALPCMARRPAFPAHGALDAPAKALRHFGFHARAILGPKRSQTFAEVPLQQAAGDIERMSP